jgi:deazaflavin-dependent oxidoreductase (nitroreductase family)
VLMSIVTVVVVIALTLTAIGSLFLLGMRRKSPLVLGPVIWISRRVLNPLQMRSAGKPGAYASIIRHRGRASGRAYETPVGVIPTDDGFVIALPYGTRTSWLRNVLASGSAMVVHEGHLYQVDQPEVVPMHDAEHYFSPGDQRSHRGFGVDRCLMLRRVGPEAAPAAPAMEGRAA